MATRKSIPAANKNSVLAEFNHLCALCGKPKPQIHHIDHDHSNNEESNLIPLCPNHHLLDAHSPTEPIAPAKLRLFRQFRDPAIFLSQFHAVYCRMSFVLPGATDNNDVDQVRKKADDLIAFISHLNMGEYYAEKIRALIGWVPPMNIEYRTAQDNLRHLKENIQKDTEYRNKYLEKVQTNAAASINLIIECLRFQEWKAKSPYTEHAL
jgi:hypothetical protein